MPDQTCKDMTGSLVDVGKGMTISYSGELHQLPCLGDLVNASIGHEILLSRCISSRSASNSRSRRLFWSGSIAIWRYNLGLSRPRIVQSIRSELVVPANVDDIVNWCTWWSSHTDKRTTHKSFLPNCEILTTIHRTLCESAHVCQSKPAGQTGQTGQTGAHCQTNPN